MRSVWCCCFFFLTLLLLPAETSSTGQKRSLDEIFPELPAGVREKVFSNEGYFQSVSSGSVQNIYAMTSTLDSQIAGAVMVKQPGFLVESILVIPDAADKYSLLDVYNALGKIRGLKGRLYYSFTRNENIPMFEDVTRLESARKNVSINDPAPVSQIPASETVYMRLKDVNFGNSYYRGDITNLAKGLRYSLTNNRNLTYFLVPVIKEEKFIAQLYFEPVTEGILIYSLAGADVSDFISSKIDMPSAISKRLAVIVEWVAEGITDG